jgi:CTP:molybdopterin cytidylyltransferase MocA
VSPHAIDVLNRLSASMPIALATSGSAASASLFLTANRVGHLFSAVVTGHDVREAKPAPDIFLSTCTRLGLQASDCLVVEDSISGVHAAVRAGCHVLGFGPASFHEALHAAGAAECIDSLTVLLRMAGCNSQRIWARRPELADPVDPLAWTTVIPAAGLGSRLHFNNPKVLFPVAGRPILDWLLDIVQPRSSRVVIVASPEGRAPIEDHLARVPGRFEVVIQPEPAGMADAVACALPAVHTRDVIVVWGDQAALLPETVDACIHLHRRMGPLGTVPTLWREHPYIHFDRDSNGQVHRILQAREGDLLPARGESDTGLFLFQTGSLARYIEQARRTGAAVGPKTREFNLLPILPMFDGIAGNLITPRIASEAESVGVNTRDDAERLARFLTVRRMATEVGA